MKAKLIGSTKKITTQEEAKRWIQNHARVCYSEKNWGDLLGENFQEGLVKTLIEKGHHSPFDHFFLSFYFEDIEKALAMVLNNQGFYVSSEKSARYTTMSEIPSEQQILYEKWSQWFSEEIKKRFPENKFHRLYFRRSLKAKTKAEELAQENARYMTSVFTPTKMTHTISWRQLNIIYHQFLDFISENEESSEEFKARLARTMQDFVNLEEIKKWILEEAQIKMKGKIPLRFFNKPLEENFGQDVYSTNYHASFAALAQLQRHRLFSYTISEGFQLGGPMGFYVPPLVEASEKTSEWLGDLESIAEKDFPQAQLVLIGEKGFRDYLPTKIEERSCGLAQLETARVIDRLLEKYSKVVPSIELLKKPSCAFEKCKKGGCAFGPNEYLGRLI